jgi:hypothetical protein
MTNTWMAPFGLNIAYVQTWASAGTYSGTMTRLESIQQLGVTQKLTQAILTGDDQETATAAYAIGATAKMRFGGLNFDSLGIILGITATTISSVIQFGMAGGHRMPYFGAFGKMLLADTTGSLVMYLPKCKIMSEFTITQGEYGAFVIPEVTVELIPDATYGIYNLIQYPTNFTLTVMPPANIAAVS